MSSYAVETSDDICVFPCPAMTSLHPSEEFRQLPMHAEILSDRLDGVREFG